MLTSKVGPILVALHQRYPTKVIPRGVLSILAEEYGVTRERVRQIAVEHGFVSLRTGHTTRPITGTLHPCLSCGKEMYSNAKVRARRDYCRDCLLITVPCEDCGKPVQRSRADMTWRTTVGAEKAAARGMPHYTGRAFCNRTCFGRWIGKHHGKSTA